MHAPSDAELTEHGMAAAGTGRLLVLACGALAREILALIRINGWDHVDLHCLPAILHNYPDKITGAVREAVVERRDGYEKVFVAYADCGTGGDLEKACAELGVEMIRGPHCYAFFEGLDVFTGRDEIYSFYLTDFLARQFDTFIWRGLKIDRHPELLPMYFGHYRTLVYLAQTDDPALTEKAQAAVENFPGSAQQDEIDRFVKSLRRYVFKG
jgi:hypothetical protein